MCYIESQDPPWPRLWGKTTVERSGPKCVVRLYHPLICHMLDVAAVAGLVWANCFSVQLRKRIERSLGSLAGKMIMFLSGAHDIGKASPGFQKKIPELSEGLGLPFSENDRSYPHGFISAHVVREIMKSCSVLNVFTQIAGSYTVFPLVG